MTQPGTFVLTPLRRQLVTAVGAAMLTASAAAAFARDGTQPSVQAQALPGAGAPISSGDRVYTADQTSNTVTVINPATNQVLGTIALGEARVDGVFGPFDEDQVNAHGLGFSRDGTRLLALAVTSNAAMVIDGEQQGAANDLSEARAARGFHRARRQDGVGRRTRRRHGGDRAAGRR